MPSGVASTGPACRVVAAAPSWWPRWPPIISAFQTPNHIPSRCTEDSRTSGKLRPAAPLAPSVGPAHTPSAPDGDSGSVRRFPLAGAKKPPLQRCVACGRCWSAGTSGAARGHGRERPRGWAGVSSWVTERKQRTCPPALRAALTPLKRVVLNWKSRE